jgi:hypothetical protein
MKFIFQDVTKIPRRNDDVPKASKRHVVIRQLLISVVVLITEEPSVYGHGLSKLKNHRNR